MAVDTGKDTEAAVRRIPSPASQANHGVSASLALSHAVTVRFTLQVSILTVKKT